MESQHRPKNRVKTYQPALVRQLGSPNGAKPKAAHAAPQAGPADDTNLHSSWEQRKAAQRAALEAKARHKEELFRAAMERKRAAEEAQREATFQQLYSEVLGGLEPGSGVISEAQEVLQYAQAAQQARKEALYQQWHSQVFEPIQTRLHEAMSKSSIEDLEASLQAASHAYVQASNVKPLFRDVIINDGYDPLAPLARTIRIPTADLQDPLLHDLIKTQAEKNLLQAGLTGSGSNSSGGNRSPSSRCGSRGVRLGESRASSRASSRAQPGQLGGGQCSTSAGSSFGLAKATTRPMRQTQQWAAGQIHATPYGHCIDDRTAEYIVRPAAPASLAQKASSVFFDDFTPCP